MLNLAHYCTRQIRITTNDSAWMAIEFREVLDAEPKSGEALFG
jgi:hypothetical protein